MNRDPWDYYISQLHNQLEIVDMPPTARIRIVISDRTLVEFTDLCYLPFPKSVMSKGHSFLVQSVEIKVEDKKSCDNGRFQLVIGQKICMDFPLFVARREKRGEDLWLVLDLSIGVFIAPLQTYYGYFYGLDPGRWFGVVLCGKRARPLT